MIQKCSRDKVLAVFLENPTKRFQIREIGRTIGLAQTSVKLHLTSLIKEKLVEYIKEDNFKGYKANFESEKFKFYKKINNLLKLEETGLTKKLEKLYPDTIILFGSFAKGEDIETSDIDIYLKCKEKNIDLKKEEKLLNRKIQLFFSEDINKYPKELKNNIINGIKISGYLKI